MHKNAASIITSHKSAASRAAAHLLSTRHLKMSPSAALELVACVLNDSNWQTLLGMAEQGKSPQYPAGKPKVEKGAKGRVAGTTLTRAQLTFAEECAREDDVGAQLEKYYAATGQHPTLKHEDWSDEFEEHNTRLEYWPWVAHQMDARGEMLPWTRDANKEAQIAAAAGITVSFEGDKWFASHCGPVDSSTEFELEAEFWSYAASLVPTWVNSPTPPVEFPPIPDSEGPFDVMLDGRQYGLHDDIILN